MDSFWDVLVEVDLSNMGYRGHWYTWERGWLPHNNIRERLDRGIAC